MASFFCVCGSIIFFFGLSFIFLCLKFIAYSKNKEKIKIEPQHLWMNTLQNTFEIHKYEGFVDIIETLLVLTFLLKNLQRRSHSASRVGEYLVGEVPKLL